MKNIITFTICAFNFISCNSSHKNSELIAQNQVNSKLEASINRGQVVYDDMCITCHLADGKGVPKVYPPLAESDYLRENQIESIKAVKFGMSGEITVNGITYISVMSPLGLSNEEVADVINYINNSWGNAIDNFMTPEKVSKL